jgi:hypothetical protein
MIRPSFARTIRPKSEGAGKAGCPLHPQPRVQSVESTRVRHHRSTGTPGLPCAMVLTVSFALSPVIGLFCHRHLADTSAKLDASVEASGPHDFAVRKPTPSSEALPASTASRPAFMTIASRPLWDETVKDMQVIWVRGIRKYFCREDWGVSSIQPDEGRYQMDCGEEISSGFVVACRDGAEFL